MFEGIENNIEDEKAGDSYFRKKLAISLVISDIFRTFAPEY